MAEITAGLVKELRERTQLPMMDCKKALTEANGDIAKAEDILRKSGALTAASKAGRETAEGRVSTFIGDDGHVGGIVEIRCETAPVANNQIFTDMCKQIAQHVAGLKDLPEQAEKLYTQPLSFNPSQTTKDVMDFAINRLRENMQIMKYAQLHGEFIGCYEHHNGQVAVLIQLEVDPSVRNDERISQLARDLCMQVTAINPLGLNRESVPEAKVDEAKKSIQGQVENESKGKPANIIEKMTIGKLNKWYNENVLLEQPFVKDDKKTITQVVNEVSKAVGKPVTVKKYLRFEVGGVDKAC